MRLAAQVASIDTVVRQHHAESKVTFLDWVRFDQLHAFMDFIVYSFTRVAVLGIEVARVGALIVLLDAQATAMPVTTHDAVRYPKLIHNETKLLTAERDVDS